MLSLNNISKSYGIETVLEDVSFVVNPGERVGLVGPNGCGKSTLLRIIAGEEAPDGGDAALASSATLGYLRQGMKPRTGRTITEEVTGGVTGWEDARARMDALAAQMADASGDELARIMKAYDRAAARFEALGGYAIEHQAETLLAKLGLGAMPPETPVAHLSGGEQTRVMLAGLLLSRPDLLLLDEPTNHLDIDMLEWLEEFLATYPGAALVVSHDRAFLDKVVTRVIAIDEKTHQAAEYTGSYSDYAAQKAAALDRQWEAWKADRAEERRVRADIHRTKMHAMSVELTTTPGTPGPRRYAKKVAKKALSREKKLDRFLESDERADRPDRHWQMKLDFGEMPRGGQDVMTLSHLGHRFEGADWLFRDVNVRLSHGERVVLLGPNGSGKSTLLRALVGEITPTEGELKIGANVQVGYMPQKQEAFTPGLTPLALILENAAMSETDARNFLHYFLFKGDDVFLPVEKLSYGQRSRLLLAKLVVNGSNCLVLDEPVNHLDIPSRERFEEALGAFPGAILIVAHDRALIDRFATRIWSLEDGMIRCYLDRAEMRKARLRRAG